MATAVKTVAKSKKKPDYVKKAGSVMGKLLMTFIMLLLAYFCGWLTWFLLFDVYPDIRRDLFPPGMPAGTKAFGMFMCSMVPLTPALLCMGLLNAVVAAWLPGFKLNPTRSIERGVSFPLKAIVVVTIVGLVASICQSLYVLYF